MLVLTRKKMQSIEIGNGIVVKVLQIDRNTVKLGIEAPKDVRVLRAELDKFETAPATVAEVKVNSQSSSNEKHDEMDADVDYASLLKFTTEYAVEIEDQVMSAIPC